MIKEKLERYLKDQKEEKYYLSKEGVFHASECGKCPRFIYLDKINPTSYSTSTKKVFLLGNIFHEFIQKNLLKGYKIEDEIKGIVEGIKIVGRIDAHDENEVIELKTCSDTKYISKPYADHIVQINIYMHFLKLNKGVITYISKSNLNIIEFSIKYNQELFEHTINKIKYINQKIKEKIDPLTITPEISPFCYSCKYKTVCFPKQY